MNKPNSKFRWPITFGFTIVFGLVGLALGWSIDTKHPDDRLADVLIPTMIFLTSGFLIGYVVSLVIYKRFRWFDAVASLAIPLICFIGFINAKSGNWTTGLVLGYVALALVVFLVWRFIYNSRDHVHSDTVEIR